MLKVIRVQRMTRKWGSCSTAGTVTLAIDLDEELEAFQDFVIAHELLHLEVPNHGRLFTGNSGIDTHAGYQEISVSLVGGNQLGDRVEFVIEIAPLSRLRGSEECLHCTVASTAPFGPSTMKTAS
jgi:Protein of unknown function DUF45